MISEKPKIEQHLADRDTHWLTPKRLLVYPRMIVAILLVTSVAWVLLSKNMVDLKGKPLGYDFITFWAASHVGLAGHPVDAYNIPLLFKAEQLPYPHLRGSSSGTTRLRFIWSFCPWPCCLISQRIGYSCFQHLPVI